jgi:hypothetical protein
VDEVPGRHYLVESYRPDLDAGQLEEEGRRLVRAWAPGVACVEGIVVPADHALLFVVEAPSAVRATEAGRRLGISVDRVAAATLEPGRQLPGAPARDET